MKNIIKFMRLLKYWLFNLTFNRQYETHNKSLKMDQSFFRERWIIYKKHEKLVLV